MKNKVNLAILGAGSWGTAVAVYLANNGHKVHLWAQDSAQIKAMNEKRCNARYLPEITLPKNIQLTVDIREAVTQADHVFIAVPSQAFDTVLSIMPKPEQGLAWLTKGIDPTTQKPLSELVKQRWGATYPIAAISGPSFAKEVALGLPTALVIASHHLIYQQTLQDIFHSSSLRAYLSDDLIGVQLCGVVKNILAIACGISDGIGYGANAKAALITRGLAEMQRLLAAFHGKSETCLGLAGVGDLVLTCTDNQSRNRRFGLLLGQGIDAHTAEKTIDQVVEGKHNAAQVCALANQYHIEMPICQAVQAVLSHQKSAQEAVSLLMNRPPKAI